MPTYQYECSDCGHEFEMLQSMRDKKIRKCPKCGKFKVERLIGSGTGIIFKGSGFYQTDYKNKGSDSKSTVSAPAAKPKPAAGGGCGSGCGCHP